MPMALNGFIAAAVVVVDVAEVLGIFCISAYVTNQRKLNQD